MSDGTVYRYYIGTNGLRIQAVPNRCPTYLISLRKPTPITLVSIENSPIYVPLYIATGNTIDTLVSSVKAKPPLFSPLYFSFDYSINTFATDYQRFRDVSNLSYRCISFEQLIEKKKK